MKLQLYQRAPAKFLKGVFMYRRQSFDNDDGTMAGRAQEIYVSAFMQRRSLGIENEKFDEDVFRLHLMVPEPNTLYFV